MVCSVELPNKLKRSNQVGREEFSVVDEVVDGGLRIGVCSCIEADVWHSTWNFNFCSHVALPVPGLLSFTFGSSYGSLSAPRCIEGSNIPKVCRGVSILSETPPAPELKVCCTRCKLLRSSWEILVMMPIVFRALFVYDLNATVDSQKDGDVNRDLSWGPSALTSGGHVR
jgi:hypothetical protein